MAASENIQAQKDGRGRPPTTEETKAEIRRLYEVEGWRREELAAHFGLSYTSIATFVKGLTKGSKAAA